MLNFGEEYDILPGREGKPLKRGEMVEDCKSILDYYRKCRGITITELASRAGLKRQMVSEMCDGEKIKPKYIGCLAKALYVEEGDLNQSWYPEEMVENQVPIGKLTEDIDKVIEGLKPCQIKGKARWLAAYLTTEDKKIQEIVDYVVCQADTMGLITLHEYLLENFEKPGGAVPEIPEPYGKKNQKIYQAVVAGEEKAMTKLARYMRYRDKRVDDVADETGLTRQTVGAARNGRKVLSRKNQEKVAKFLNVELQDLAEDGRGWISIPLEKENIHAAINVCHPHNFERKAAHLCRWLEDWAEDRDPDYRILTGILEFLLTETDQERLKSMVEGLLDIRNKPAVRRYLRKDHESIVEVGYQAVEDSEGEYEAFVVFDPWFYDFFGVDRHVSEVTIKELALNVGRGEVQGDKTYTTVDMPISCSARGRKDYTRGELEGAILDGVKEYMEGLEVSPESEMLYRRYLEECLDMELNCCRINEFTGNDSLRKICEGRIRNIRYEHVLRELYRSIVGDNEKDEWGDGLEQFLFTAAELFAGIVTRPEEEEERLKKRLTKTKEEN